MAVKKKAVKKTAAKKSVEEKVKSSAPKKSSSGRGALLVLIIMVLLTVIALMYSRYHSAKAPEAPAKVEQEMPKVEVAKEDETLPVAPTEEAKPEVKQEEPVKKEVKPVEPKKEVKKAEVEKQEKLTPDKKLVKIYLLRYNEKSENIDYISVKRAVVADPLLKNTIAVLMEGITDREKNAGYITALSSKIRVLDAKVEGGIAVIDFDKNFAYGLYGDILASRINQIFFTAKQFPGVKGITLKINGKEICQLGSDGRQFSWPMTRKL